MDCKRLTKSMHQMWALLNRIRKLQIPQDAGKVFPRQSVLTAKTQFRSRVCFYSFMYHLS